MSPSLRTFATALAVCVPALLTTCGGDGPTGATPPSTTPPVTAAPAPPTPAPPDPLPGAASCSRIGEGARVYTCREESPTFHEQVQAAIDELVRDKPQLFENTELGLKARSSGQFYVGVIQKLDQKGLCAAFDGEEVGVKSEQSFSDQYHLLTTNFIVRQGLSSYQVTCYPAAFPTPAPPYAPSNGCTLPSSREITCGRESAAFYGDVDASISQVARENPQVFDLTDARGEGGYKIADPDGFKARLFDAMRSRGYCGRHDGEEFVFKKGNNTFSEHYDLESSQGYVRRGDGTYASTCYPAAF